MAKTKTNNLSLAIRNSSLVIRFMDVLWLGYDNLSVRYADIAAVLFYQAPLDRLITRAYGCVPANIRAVVITIGGEHWPSSRHAEQLRRRWAHWRNATNTNNR